MSSHTSRKKRSSGHKAPSRSGGNGFLASLRIYPDFGLDSECYEISTVKIIIAVLGAAVVFAVSAFSDSLSEPVRVIAGAAGFLCASCFCIENLAISLSRGRVFCEALPVFLSCTAVLLAGGPKAAAVTVLLYEALKIFETECVRRQHEKAAGVLNILPRYAQVIMPDGSTSRRKPVHIREGDTVIVGKGEIIPIDGIITDGMSNVDCSPLTLDRDSVHAVGPGSKVLSGCVNAGAPLTVRASCDYAGSTARRIFSSFSSAIKSQSEEGSLIQKIYNIYYPVIIALAVVFGIIVPLFGREWAEGARKAAAVLMCACPAGVAGTLDLCRFAGVRGVFASGAVIRDGKLLSRISNLESFVCNKTGTVTEKTYRVAEVIPAGYSSENPPPTDCEEMERLLSTALISECRSSHPIALAMREYCGKSIRDPGERLITDEIPGKGISAFLDSDSLYCGNAALLAEHGISCPVPETPGTALHVAFNDRYLGYIVLSNNVRPGNYDALERLRSLGIKNLSLLSSDLRSIVRPIAASSSFSNVRAELSPEKKKGAVRYLMGAKAQGRTLAYLGNGSDELECASLADVSVLSGVLYDEEASSAADVAVFSEGISGFAEAAAAGDASVQISGMIMWTNLASRAVLTVLAVSGTVPLLAAACIIDVIAAVSLLFAGKTK